MKHPFWGILASAPLAVCLASVASAQQATAPTEPTAVAAPTETATPAASANAFGNAAAIDESDLGKVTGRENTATLAAIATQRNTVSGNSVSGNSVTGGVQIDGNAFQNLQGLAVISANSGNNVAINSAMNVTINLGAR